MVGGGSAGWMSATYLDRVLNRGPTKQVQISLVESADIGIIGVGEATLPTLRRFLSFIDVDEREFMRGTNASFKNAIKHVNWRLDPSVQPTHYYHPFGSVHMSHGLPIIYYWLARRRAGHPEDYAYTCGVGASLSDEGRSPKQYDSKSYEGLIPYAYHLDAVLLGRFLREVAVTRGVRHVTDNVVDVLRDEEGFIAAVRTESHGDLAGDLFIDCTGFRGLLINQTLEVPFVSYSDVLFCDRAVALQVPFAPEQKDFNSFTTSTAMSGGWIWEIHLQERRGTGYVYSSQHISSDAAEAELREYLGASAEGRDARHLKMRVGRNSRLWEKNCVAVGLSGGFIEPLESTGIFLIEAGLEELVRYFPRRDFAPPLTARYNDVMGKLFDEVRDFIVLHYRLTRREDTAFWRENKYNAAISDELARNIELWRYRAPADRDLSSPLKLYGAPAYLHIVAGLDWLPDPENLGGFFDPAGVSGARIDEVLGTMRGRTRAALASSIAHGEYLAGLRGSDTRSLRSQNSDPDLLHQS